jgi:hypothetical protein
MQIKKKIKFRDFHNFRFLYVGLSNGKIPDDQEAQYSPNCYGIYDRDHDNYWHDGQRQRLELPSGAIIPEWKARLPFELATDPNRPEWNYHGDVIGCGLLLDSENELAIFFSLNGILRGLFGLGIGLRYSGSGLYYLSEICQMKEIMWTVKTSN